MSPASARSAGSIITAALLAFALLVVLAAPPRSVLGETIPDHLVISEIVTGGGSASDELIELYNPTNAALPLEGLELVYVTASGATVSRRAAWELGAPTLGPGRHLLVANELGAYAGIADALYASGIAATGGSVALRIQGASSAIDAVGWGNAVSTWLEAPVATAPSAGSSLERRPGGALGSTVDTDVNAADFLVRGVPEPQNTGSPPVPDPAATPSPSPTATASSPPSSSAPTAEPTPTPSPQPGTIPIGSARALPDGTVALVEGVALSGSDFTDGGGYVADGSGGIAVIVTGAAFTRGERLQLSGTIDDRFSQRTLRVDAADLQRIGTAAEPAPQSAATGAVGETVEGELVRVAGDLTGAGTALTTGVAFDLDDGSGPTRLVVATTTGIDTTQWKSGTRLELVGVVGQRDSTGSGSSGYRIHPRDPADVLAVSVPASPTPSGSAGPDPSGTPAPSGDVVAIAAARELPKNARATVRGTVTLPTGIVDELTGVLQDATGAIVVRLGDEAGTLSRGDVIEAVGVRSTKSGMETLRVTTPPVRVGSGPEPAARELQTGQAGEAHEARLVIVRGAIVVSPRRTSSGSVWFDLDDGSGAVRVVVAASLGMEGTSIPAGAWVEVTGVLGQETTGAQPLRGYRVWPRAVADVRVVANATGAAGHNNGTGAETGAAGGAGADAAGLDAVGAEADSGLRIGAALVSAAWPEIGLGGLLWDGKRLAGLEPSATAAIEAAIGDQRAPVSLELSGLRGIGQEKMLGLPMVRLGDAPDAILRGSSPVAPPSTRLPSAGDPPRWVAVVGRLEGRGSARTLRLASGPLAVDLRCDADASVPSGVIGLVGIATADPARIVVGCDGIRTAPALDRSGAGISPARGSSGTAALAGLAGDATDAGRSVPPVGPAALLGVAALALVGGAFVARRFRDEDEPEPDGDDGAAPAVTDEAGSPPTLTLVPLPRERSP